MVSTHKKRQSNRRLLCQLDNFNQDNIFGKTVSDRQANFTVNESTGDQYSTVGTSGNNLKSMKKR